MRFCFACQCLLLMGACASFGAGAVVQPLHKVQSVVRVDAHSGRLVRAVVVAAKPVVPKTVSAQDAETSPTAAAGAGVQEIVEATARQYDVDPLLVHSVIQVESNYNQYALSPKGAQGLMQLIPSTARRFGARNSFDAKENVEAGVKYLKYLNSLYPNDLRLTLAAYNAGEAAVAKYRNNIPPYRETEQYVYKVGQKYGNAKRAAEKKKQPPKSPPSGKVVAGERHRPIEQFVDAEGRLHLRTAANSEGANTP
ncbi:MAG TPA: lytic transglycosylase domain-containing protein [Bryobacteraceae bacterium]|nr:lytic transglycosylase domain-containing protein [Bryobacteraceae bacterium]